NATIDIIENSLKIELYGKVSSNNEKIDEDNGRGNTDNITDNENGDEDNEKGEKGEKNEKDEKENNIDRQYNKQWDDNFIHIGSKEIKVFPFLHDQLIITKKYCNFIQIPRQKSRHKSRTTRIRTNRSKRRFKQ
ncbi:hypothetical protein HEP_00530800, partial [Hepatocystis sp. ex Piliocolobus tephrosceles]